EKIGDADSFELLLDGLSRLCAQRPDDFQARLAPLLHRVHQLFKDPGYAYWWGSMRGGLMQLIRTWCESSWKPMVVHHDHKLHPIGFLLYRFQELEIRLHRRRSAPMLACPTHHGGWIDPQILVERLRQWHDTGLEQSRYDFIQALLRLAPDHRKEALDRIENFNESYVPV